MDMLQLDKCDLDVPGAYVVHKETGERWYYSQVAWFNRPPDTQTVLRASSLPPKDWTLREYNVVVTDPEYDTEDGKHYIYIKDPEGGELCFRCVGVPVSSLGTDRGSIGTYGGNPVGVWFFQLGIEQSHPEWLIDLLHSKQAKLWGVGESQRMLLQNVPGVEEQTMSAGEILCWAPRSNTYFVTTPDQILDHTETLNALEVMQTRIKSTRSNMLLWDEFHKVCRGVENILGMGRLL